MHKFTFLEEKKKKKQGQVPSPQLSETLAQYFGFKQVN
jgi:hypothetical protein